VECVRGERGIRSHLIPADDVLEFDAYPDPPDHDEPCPELHILARDRALVGAAAAVNAGTILTGEGGDDVFDIPPYYIGELLKRGRLRAAWSEALSWARATSGSACQVLSRYGLVPILPAWLRSGWGALWRRVHAPWEGQNDFTIPPWIRPGYARRYHLRGRAIANAHRALHSRHPAGLAAALSNLRSRVGDASRWYVTAPRGIALAHPFLDCRVVRLGLSLHTWLQGFPGRQKPILAEAMRDLLPAPIRNRRDKGGFDETYFLGLSRNLPHLESLVRQAPLIESDLLDRDALLDCLRRAALGVAPDTAGQDRLNLTLSLLQWSALQEKGRHRAEPPTRTTRWRQND
jgi:asparagine synthase (glutamine-hydrolysing)